MNTHLRERVEALLGQYAEVTLGTCGQAGPQIGRVSCELRNQVLVLFVPRNSDHLFNLQDQPEIALLTPTWTLGGHGVPSADVTAPHGWHIVVYVQPSRLHILSDDGQSVVETIDF